MRAKLQSTGRGPPETLKTGEVHPVHPEAHPTASLKVTGSPLGWAPLQRLDQPYAGPLAALYRRPGHVFSHFAPTRRGQVGQVCQVCQVCHVCQGLEVCLQG